MEELECERFNLQGKIDNVKGKGNSSRIYCRVHCIGDYIKLLEYKLACLEDYIRRRTDEQRDNQILVKTIPAFSSGKRQNG